MRTHRGNAAVKVALSLTVLLGFASITIDLAWARFVREQLDVAAQAASHGGAIQLDGSEAGVVAAEAVAPFVAATHYAAGTTVEVGGDDVELGVWSIYTNTFTPGGDAEEINAVRVAADRPTLPVFFAPAAFGRQTVDVGARVTAVRLFGGASEMDCVLPLAVPQCLLENEDEDGDGIIDVGLNPQTPQIDNMGWARPYHGDGANSAWTRTQLSTCQADGSGGIGDDVALQNGLVESALSELIDIIESSSTSWDEQAMKGPIPTQMEKSSIDPGRYGRTLEGPIFVFDAGDEYCEGSGGSFNGTEVVSGFVWIAIYDVQNTGGAANRAIHARLDTTRTHEVGKQGGGPDWGVTADPPPHFVASN